MSLDQNSRSEKVIIKFFRRKDASKVRTEKQKLKRNNLTSLELIKPIYVNFSLWTHFKKPWAKFKQLRDNKVIHAFWISSGLIKLNLSETCNAYTVTYDAKLEMWFLGNNLTEDIQRM